MKPFFVLAPLAPFILPLAFVFAAESQNSATAAAATAPAAPATAAAAPESPAPAPAPPSAPAPEPPKASATTLDFANGLYARKMYGPAIEEYEKFIRDNPSSPETASARFRHADSYYFMKDYASAVERFEAFVKDHPSDPRAATAWFRVGTSLYYLGRHEQASRAFITASKESADPNVRAGALFYLAKSYEALDKAEPAAGLHRQVMKGYPQTEYASYSAVALGDQALLDKRYDEASLAYQFAAEKPNPLEISVEAQFKAGEILFSQKRYADAKGHYQKLFDRIAAVGSPDRLAVTRGKALLGLFYCDYHLKDLPGALARLEPNRTLLESSGFLSDAEILVAALEIGTGRHDVAILRLEEVLARPGLSPESRENALFKKAEALAAAGRGGDALGEIEKLFGSGAEPAQGARAHFEKAGVLRSLDRKKEALDEYDAVMRSNSLSEYARPALYQAALLRLDLGDPAGARRDLARFAEIYADDPNADEAALEVIQLDLAAKRFEEAARLARAFIEGRKESELLDLAFYKLGVAETGRKDPRAAVAAFGRVVDGYPTSVVAAEALYGLATSLENAGEAPPRVIPHYEKLAAAHPRHALTREVLPRLGYLYIRTGDEPKMKALYLHVLTERPDVPLSPEAVFWFVQYLLGREDYVSIQKILPLLAARFPDHDFSHEVQFFLGESFMGQKDYEKAVMAYSEAVRLAPDGAYAPHAWLGIGIASVTRKDPAAAEKAFNESLHYDYEVKVGARARYEIANLRLGAGNLSEAAKAFMLVAILHDDPKYTPLSLYKAGECFRRTGKPEDAEKAFDELLTRYPKNLWARKARKERADAAAADGGTRP